MILKAHNVCDDLNENGLHGLMCLNTWSPEGKNVWEGLGGVALLEEAMGEGFKVAKGNIWSYLSTFYLWIKT